MIHAIINFLCVLLFSLFLSTLVMDISLLETVSSFVAALYFLVSFQNISYSNLDM